LKPIETPPFYGVRLWPKVHHTMGGLHISEKAQVMNIDHKPIEGLYAAGEVAGGFHGGDRLGSCATLDCITFGRIAGHSAATRTVQPSVLEDLTLAA
jgi:succinate dehydrogenase/fumarate reductase flavoprotein subunit